MDARILEELAISRLFTLFDNAQATESPERLPAWLRAMLDARLVDAAAKNSAADLAVGDQQGAAARVEQAVGKLGELLRNGHRHLGSLLVDDGEPGPGKFTAADLDGVYEAYGWKNRFVGDLSSTSVVTARAQSALDVTPGIPAAGRYPTALVERLGSWLAIFHANESVAGGGSRQTIIDARDKAYELLEKVNARARHYLCCVSDDVDQTPLLSQVGLQPRRDRGEAQAPAKPAVPGPVSFDAVGRALSVASLPDHATSLRAFRQPAGGPPELAGVSATTTVSVVDFSPLEPGVSYAVWLVGKNSAGTGPESSPVTFVA